MIPLVDLQAAHAEVAEEVDAGFKRVLANTAFVGGEEVTAFEREFAEFSGVAHCVGVANGTDAVELALRAPTGRLRYRRDGRAGTNDVIPGEARSTPRSTWRPHDDPRLETDQHGLGLDPADGGDLWRRRS